MASLDLVTRSIYSAAKYVREETVPEYCEVWRETATDCHKKYAVAWDQIEQLPPDVLPWILKDLSEHLRRHLHDELRLFVSHRVSLHQYENYARNRMTGLLEPYEGHYVAPGTNYTKAFLETRGHKVALTEYPPAGISLMDGFDLWDEYYRNL